MISNSPTGRKPISTIDDLFVDIVGPIGQLLTEDAKNLWRQKQWQGPSALRNYIKALANNIDSVKDRERFIKESSRVVMDAAAAQNKISTGN
jgi:hypothetical protein